MLYYHERSCVCFFIAFLSQLPGVLHLSHCHFELFDQSFLHTTPTKWLPSFFMYLMLSSKLFLYISFICVVQNTLQSQHEMQRDCLYLKAFHTGFQYTQLSHFILKKKQHWLEESTYMITSKKKNTGIWHDKIQWIMAKWFHLNIFIHSRNG